MKNLIKRVLALALVLCIVLPVSVLAADAPSDWARAEVSRAATLGLVPEDLRSRYQDNITRGDFCRLLVRFAEVRLDIGMEEYLALKNLTVRRDNFSDNWILAIDQMYALGVVNGIGDNKFNPNGTVTRQAAAVMLEKTVKALELLTPQRRDEPAAFSDREAVAPWAIGAMEYVSTLYSGEYPDVMAGGSAASVWYASRRRAEPIRYYSREAAICTMLRLYCATDNISLNVDYSRLDSQLDTACWGNGSSHSGLSGLTSNYSAPYGGYLFPRENGFRLVTQAAQGILVEDYENHRLTSRITLPLEAELFGGVHLASDGYYYVLQGGSNATNQNAREAIRIIRYDEGFNRIDHLSISAGELQTTVPFDAGRPRFADDGQTLVIHTSRERYTAEDGLNHQSNLTIKIDMERFAAVYVSELFPKNHVSHSFDQYVLMEEGKTVYLDHGDAYPRALVLQVERAGGLSTAELVRFEGAGGNNYTGFRPGGLAASESSYLVAASFDKNKAPYHSNILLTVTQKAEIKKTRQIWLTDNNAGITTGAPKLVPLGSDRFAVLWDEYGYEEIIFTPGSASGSSYETTARKSIRGGRYLTTKYLVIDGKGQIVRPAAEIYNARLHDGLDPVLHEGSLLWLARLDNAGNGSDTDIYLFRLDVGE